MVKSYNLVVNPKNLQYSVGKISIYLTNCLNLWLLPGDRSNCRRISTEVSLGYTQKINVCLISQEK